MKTHPQIITHTSVHSHARDLPVVARVLEEALKVLHKESSVLELHLVSNAQMKAINRATRGKDEPTNVLSFESDRFSRADVEGKYIGEIYLAPQVIRARGEDMKFLAIHGLLHLLKYTHKTKRDRMIMERKEDTLLDAIADRV